MSKITKTIAALGVVAGLGVAALPLASYAATTQDIVVKATIGESLTVTAPTSATVELTPTNGAAAVEKSSSVTVNTNHLSGFTLNIKDSDAETGLTGTGGTIAAGTTLDGTASAWAYKGGDKATYTAITATDVALKTTSAPTTADGETVEITFAVAADEDQAAGTYTGGVTVTAVANA